MKNQAEYSKYECPYSHIDKECGHELKGPEGYQDTYGVWCACGFRGPVFCLNPEELKLNLKVESELKDDDKIVVCAECLKASCWLGEFMCDESKYADITTKTVKELKTLNLEHSSYWERSRQVTLITMKEKISTNNRRIKMIKLKNESVKLNWESMAHVRIIGALYLVSMLNNDTIIITSGNDSKHSKESLHYKDRAIDIRSWNLRDKLITLDHLKKILGKEFDVVYEKELKDSTGKITRGEHIHIEYDQK